ERALYALSGQRLLLRPQEKTSSTDRISQTAVASVTIESQIMSAKRTVTVAAAMLAGAAAAQTVNFDNLQPGVAPPGWTATQTGSGHAKWTIEKDDTAPSKPNVLKQSGTAAYPVCTKDDTSLSDGYVTVLFKPIFGKEDLAG